MSTSPVSTGSAAPVPKPMPPKSIQIRQFLAGVPGGSPTTTPILVVILAFGRFDHHHTQLECVGRWQGRPGHG